MSKKTVNVFCNATQVIVGLEIYSDKEKINKWLGQKWQS